MSTMVFHYLKALRKVYNVHFNVIIVVSSNSHKGDILVTVKLMECSVESNDV